MIAIALAAFAFYRDYQARLARVEADKSAEVARNELKARIDLEVKKHLNAAERLLKMKPPDPGMARSILEEARKLDSANVEVNKLLEELQ